MKKFTLFTIAVFISTFSFAQFQDDFDPTSLSGWVLAQSATIKSSSWPANTATANAITTAGAGANSPARILTPVVAKTGSTVQVCLNIWLMESSYNNVVSTPCPTTMDVKFIKSTVTSIQDVDIPANVLAAVPGGVTLPSMGGQVCFQFTFPATVTDPNFKVLISFSASCNQSSNKYVIDNTQISGVINTGCSNSVNGCGASDNNCPPQPLNDNFSVTDDTENSWSGVLYGKNASYPDMGASYKADVNGNDGDANNAYSQISWSLVPNSVSPAGSASVSVNTSGTFNFTRTNTTVGKMTFQYNICANGMDGIAANCDDRCTLSTVTVLYPVTLLLPVTWTSFNISSKDGFAVLYWTTGMELNSKGFEIERKTGNDTYKTIGFVAAQSAGGSTTDNHGYQFTDPEAIGNDIRYYRLKEVSVDNRYTYSDIKTVRGRQSGFDINIYPNPAEGGRANINLPQGNDSYTITLQDVNGKTLAGWKNTGGGTLPVTGLSQGFYFIQAQNMATGEKKVQKLVVPR